MEIDPKVPYILAAKLRRSIQTAQNDDDTEPCSEMRVRHVARVVAMAEAVEFLDELAGQRREGEGE